MNQVVIDQIKIDHAFNPALMQGKSYLVVSHATRIPPHIGMLIDNCYHSLTVKGQDINIPFDRFLKNTNIRKIPTLFFELEKHEHFNDIYLKNRFIECIKEFPRVDVGVATCLSPIKLFLDDEYGLNLSEAKLLRNVLDALKEERLLASTTSLFIDGSSFDQISDLSLSLGRDKSQLQ